MRHLNYNHLLYFWTVAQEGSIARASDQLNLTPQTISGQLKLLEDSVGEPLFHRVGRGLTLSDTGQFVNEYANEIFSLGAELAQYVKEKRPNSPKSVTIGIVDSIPKSIAYRILEPLLTMDTPVRPVCLEGSLDKLLGELALHKIDMMLSDRVLPTGLGIKAYNHSLGKSEVGLFIQKKQSKKFKNKFPHSLNSAPFLLPVANTALRRNLSDWLTHHSISPRVVAEFDDVALLKMFGAAGKGVFPAPAAISAEIESMYNAHLIGIAEGVTESFYAITPERKLKNQAVIRINEIAHEWLVN
jgi:LysR family transcriptional activator of nhaA